MILKQFKMLFLVFPHCDFKKLVWFCLQNTFFWASEETFKPLWDARTANDQHVIFNKFSSGRIFTIFQVFRIINPKSTWSLRWAHLVKILQASVLKWFVWMCMWLLTYWLFSWWLIKTNLSSNHHIKPSRREKTWIRVRTSGSVSVSCCSSLLLVKHKR